MASESGPSSRRPTLADVAARAGVSVPLVSIVMRDAPGASAVTRERVRRIAEELGYRPALADAARDQSVQSSQSTDEKATGSDGPLGHGRAAIRGSGGRSTRERGSAAAADQPAQLGDILARRRA